MGNVVRRIALVAILGAALATIVGDALAQETINPNRITRIEVLTPSGEPPRVRIYWNHIQRSTSPAIYRVVLGRVVTTGNADYDAGRHETFNENPRDINHIFSVTVGIECWVPVTVEETQEMMCEGSQYGNITTLAVEANQVSFLRIYGYNANGGLVDIDPVNTGRDYIWIRQNDPIGPIVEAGIVDAVHEMVRRNYGGVRFGAAAFPPAPTNTPVPTNTPTPTATPLPALNVGPQISADGGAIPPSGRDLTVHLTSLSNRHEYRVTLSIDFDPTITTSQATAASGWDGVCGTASWETWIYGQTDWDVIARLRACERPPWGMGVTGTTNLAYELVVRVPGPIAPGGIIPVATVSSGTLTSLMLIYTGPTPTPTPTAAPGAQPNADVWFNPVGSLGENVIGIGGDTAKAAMISALALAATVLAFQFSRSLPVAILGGTLVIIGGVPLGLTPIWVIAGLGMTGIVISGFALFFRGA